MRIVLAKPRIIDYTGAAQKNPIGVKWDNADGIACTGFMRLFQEKEVEFDWLRCISRTLEPDELEAFVNEVSSKLSNADLLIRVGSPAWFNETDITVYNTCIENNIPFSMMSIGVGCKWHKHEWHIFDLKEDSLVRIAESEQLKLISCREPNCYSLFTRSVPSRIEINGCLGYLCLPPSIKYSKERVIVEVLHYNTLKDNGRFNDDEIHTYYSEIKDVIEFFEERSDVALMLQRPIFSPVVYSEYPQVVDIESMTDENRIVWEEYFADKLPVFCSSYDAFEYLFKTNDVLIGGRVHGVLPAAGHGLACFGLGIDMRQFTWSTIPSITRKDIRRMPYFSQSVKEWWSSLDIEALSDVGQKIRSDIEDNYNRQFDYLMENTRQPNGGILPNDIVNKYKVELLFSSNKKAITKEEFLAKADSVKNSYKNSFIVEYELDDLLEEEIAPRIKDLTETYDYVFLLSEKDIKWWDNYLKKIKFIIVNAELSNGFRKAVGKDYIKYLSVFYCLEKKYEDIPPNNRDDASVL